MWLTSIYHGNRWRHGFKCYIRSAYWYYIYINTGDDRDSESSQSNTKSTKDAIVLEFDFVPENEKFVFEYVFASDEYNEFANSTFNDKTLMTKCAIALGSNLGNSLDILENSLTALANIPGIEIKNTSSWYQTKPVGNIDPQPDYLNGCAVLEVAQNPTELLTILQATEVEFGRVRKKRWEARTLDLDLLLYDDLILDSPNLTIPHPRMHERAFVLVPLAEIAPLWIEPVSRTAIAKLLKSVDTSGVKPYVVG